MALTDRQTEVARRRLHGRTTEQISNDLGITHDEVNAEIAAIRATWRAEMTQSWEDHVAEEYAYLRELSRCLERGIRMGDPVSIDKALKISEKRSSLLGLDAPKRQEIRTYVTVEQIDAEIARVKAELSEHEMLALTEPDVVDAEVVEDDHALI